MSNSEAIAGLALFKEFKMMKKIIGLAAILALSVPLQSMATVYEVKALENSTSGGVGLAVGAFTVGDAFTVSVNPLDLWNAGALPRWSNADGLTGLLAATGLADTNGDNPGVSAGVNISDNFGNWNQGGLSAPFGTLVGEWSNAVGTYFTIGTNYTGVAADSALKLYYFDSNNGDNTGSILADVNVTAVPEPETYGMMLFGLGMVGFMVRRRKNEQI
jgi:hypothetical protein